MSMTSGNTKMRLVLVLAAGALLGSCYASAGPGDTHTDVFHDVAGDDADAGPDMPLDLRPDAPPDIPLEQDADAPPDLPPFEGMTIVIENDSSMSMYFTVWGGNTPETAQFDFQLLTSDDREVEMYDPWCTVGCGTFTDPDMCCMDCAPPPWVNTVRLLRPGQLFRVWWGGTIYEMDYESCPCGCDYSLLAPRDLYQITICGSPDIMCFGPGLCSPDADGFIQGAALSDFITCQGQEFSVPEISGGTVTLRF